ncbi:unnamed protein product [Adineta steineri]|uniref:Homeobox domain-containing protein n=1 Tax=Adineta steineri TaxID=433720 RepID=A0A815NJI6_9BILA|nr:unnamed protein product [Adineta steineri]CAF1625839.1 unnamed protein product [Adineta steineri]
MGTVTSIDEQNQPTNESKIKHQRCRRTFTYYQIVESEKAFSYCKYPTKRERCELARRSGLNERQVRFRLFRFGFSIDIRQKWLKDNIIGYFNANPINPNRYYPQDAA